MGKKTQIILVIILVVGVFLVAKNLGGTINNWSSDSSDGQLSQDLISCRFDVVSDFTQEGTGKIKYQTNKQENPIPIIFANLSGENPVMKGNGGDAPLTILKNDDETMILLEQTLFGDSFFYTIFKKHKIAVWQKAYVLLDSPFALVSMGYCN